MKTKVAVMFGGRSVEHEVSVISGLQAFNALNREKYEPVPVYITKNNEFYTGEAIGEIKNYRNLSALLEAATRVLLVPGENSVEMVRYPMKKFGNNVVGSFEVVLPVVHGTNVEDGTLMGMLEMLGVPYAACDVTSSALGMDKFHMKSVLNQAGVPVLKATHFTGKEYAKESDAILQDIEDHFEYPVIVKPINLGSSVGISKAGDRESLKNAIDTAFGYASQVLVEHAVPHLREINCSVLGDIDGCKASACEEPFGNDAILSFEDKYCSGGKGGSKGGKSGGMSDLKRRCPADISEELKLQVQELAVKTFRALGCTGVARIDFLNNTETGEVWVNEINTIPGSLSFYLWEATGMSFSELLTNLIDLAFKRQRDRLALTFQFDTNILENAAMGGAKGAKSR